ncbi:MAG: hypothetical protein LUQ66_08210 [Methanoregula sp.]|nr:hypothetical protein [Methanoregula sp.]
MEAIIHGPILEEITISGSDIHDAEFYQLIMEKGEIRKVVVYLDTIQNLQIGAVIKIFSDGKISIIPEIQVDRVVSIFDKILKGLEIV